MSEQKLVKHLERNGNPVNASAGNPDQDRFNYHGGARTKIWPIPGRPGVAIQVEDGDTYYEVPVDSNGNGNFTERNEKGVLTGASAFRLRYMDTQEIGIQKTDPKTGELLITPPDPLGASQSKVLEDSMVWAIQNGYTITSEYSNYGKDKYGRSIVRAKFFKEGEDPIDYNAVALKNNYAEFRSIGDQKRPDNDTVNPMKSLQAANVSASAARKGISDPKLRLAIIAAELEQQDKPFEFKVNSKSGQTSYDLSDDKYYNKVKIGDVWLEIPPTHLMITQLRSSYSVPTLGNESKPIASSITNRIIIKTNLIFSGDRVNTDLRRILKQFLYVPFNIIRSRDLFTKLGGEATWLSLAYDNTGSYCVPVTMDEYTLYTIEGHPGAIGCALQFSLFNYTAYFNQTPGSRLEYYKYSNDFYSPTGMNEKVELDETIRVKADADLEKIFETTFNLEDSIHPYNFIIEHELSSTDDTFSPSLESPSAIQIAKIEKDKTMKEYRQVHPAGMPNPGDMVTIIAGSAIDAVAHSVSVTFQNNFSWQPLIGASQPVAQYIGPGATSVSVNIKTNDDKIIAKLMKTYSQLLDTTTGFYDDRYLISTPILNLVDARILSLQNATFPNIDGKPGWTDISLMFNKSTYESMIATGHEPVAFDRYWGLGRLIPALSNYEIDNLLHDIDNSTKDNSLVDKLPVSGNVDLSPVGTMWKFKAAINRTLAYIKGLNGVGLNGESIFRRLKVEGNGNSPLVTSVLQAKKLIKSPNKLLDPKIGYSWKNNTDFTSRITLPDGTPYITSSRKDEYTAAISKIINDPAYEGIGDKKSIVLSLESTDAKEINAVKTILAGGRDFDSMTSSNREIQKMSISGPKTRGKRAVFTIVGDKLDFDLSETEMNTANAISEAEAKTAEKVRSELEIAAKTGRLVAKPHAAHRYFKYADDMVAGSTIVSKTLGYWFVFDQVQNNKGYFRTITEAVKHAVDPFKDTDAWKAVYDVDTAFTRIKQSATPYNPLDIMKAIAEPNMIRSRHELELVDGKRRINTPLIAAVGDPKKSDFPFSTFSDVIFSKDYFAVDNEGGGIGKHVREFIKNQSGVTDYRIADEAREQAIKVYDGNSLKGVILPGSNTLSDPSKLTTKDIDLIAGNDVALTDAVPTNRWLMEIQGIHASMSKQVTTTTYGEEQAVAKSPKYGKGEHAVMGTSYNKDDYKDEEEVLDVTYVLPTDPNLINEAINTHLSTLKSTVGIQNAFPTYKLYIIHDDTSDYKYNSLDDYWDFRLVQDIMVVRDRNNPSHILKCRLIVDPRYVTTTPKIPQKTGRFNQPTEYKTDHHDRENMDTEKEFMFSQGRSPLRQGMRVCLKLGYHTDPRALDTVFIGTITNLGGRTETGIYELEAQGDGRELLVQPTIRNEKISGENFADIISQILRSNPNVCHFGKTYGTHLERLSRKYKTVMALFQKHAIPGMLGAAGIPLLLFSNPIALGLGVAGAGITCAVAVGSIGPVKEELVYQLMSKDIPGRFKVAYEDLKKRVVGNVFDADKASYQISKLMFKTFEAGNNPIDDNIWAVDIWAKGQGVKINLEANNNKTIWDIMTSIKRVYPNFALDVRPYGSRSTVYMGPNDFKYWRTDDPLLAMAPSLIEINKAKDLTPQIREAVSYLSPERNARGNTINAGSGVAPLIPFVKTHMITSFEDIIHNGIKGSPERGWNSVVVTISGKDGKPGEPIEFVADADLHPGAIRRVYENISWTDDERIATQYALGLLKDGVEKLYGGTVIIRGNQKIEPYDRVYIADFVNKMYGWFQVDTVIHKFDSEMGFTTHIVPAMICAINNTSYMSSGDIMKRQLVDKLRRMDVGDYVGLAFTVALGVTGVGAFASLAYMAAYEGSVALYRYIAENTETDKKVESGSVDAKESEMLYFQNKWRRTTDAYIDSLAYSFFYGLGMTGRLFAEGKIAPRKLISEGISLTEKAAFGTIDIANQIKASGKEGMGAVKGAMLSRHLDGKILEEFKLAKVPEGSDDLLKKMFNEMPEDVKVKYLGPEAKVEDLAEAIKKRKIKPVFLEEAWEKVGAKTSRGFEKIFASKGLRRIGGMGIAGLMIGAAEAIPMMMETFAIKATTKHQCIYVSPLWHKDSLLMPGLDGYKNNDVWMHMKGFVSTAKEAITEGLNSLADSDTVTYFSNEDAFEKPEQSEIVAGASKVVKAVKNAFTPKDASAAIEEKKKTDGFKSYKEKVVFAARELGLDPALMLAIVHKESEWNPGAKNKRSGALGLCQLMPKTASGLKVDPNIPEENIQGGAKFLAEMLSSFNGNVKQALAAYNAGPATVQAYRDGTSFFDKRRNETINPGKIKTPLGIPPYKETQKYVKIVMELYEGYRVDLSKMPTTSS